MWGRRASTALIATAAVSIAGCGVSAAQENTSGEATTAGGVSSEDRGAQRISQTSSPVVGTSYVSPLVELYGDVFIGERSFVAGNTVLRAAPERRSAGWR